MRQTHKITLFSSVSALLVHALVFIAVGWYFSVAMQSLPAGTKRLQTVTSYLYQTQDTKKIAVQQQSSAPPARSLLVNKAKVKQPRTIEKSTEKSQQAARHVQEKSAAKASATSPSTAAPSAAQINALLSLLHAAIQQHQHYPANALEMEREGRVNLRFKLFPEGAIANLRINKSSGTASLDAAALAAVRDAVPFKRIEPYLQQAQEFSIDVVFELANESG